MFNAGVGVGAFNALKSTVTGAVSFLANMASPAGQVEMAVNTAMTVQAIADNPDAVVDAVVDNAKSTANTLVNGSSFEQGQIVGGAAVAVADIAVGTKGAGSLLKTASKVEDVLRVMSKAELNATKQTSLLRGGREGTHYATDAVSSDAKRARQRLALPQTPEVKATLEVKKGTFSNPSKVKPANNMPGGGSERTATGKVPVKIKKVEEMQNTGN